MWVDPHPSISVPGDLQIKIHFYVIFYTKISLKFHFWVEKVTLAPWPWHGLGSGSDCPDLQKDKGNQASYTAKCSGQNHSLQKRPQSCSWHLVKQHLYFLNLFLWMMLQGNSPWALLFHLMCSHQWSGMEWEFQCYYQSQMKASSDLFFSTILVWQERA